MQKRGAGGFTLLEILVVLLLSTMIGGLLLQGMEQVYRLQRQLGQETFNSGEGEMLASMFRESIRGLSTDYSEGKNRLKGDARQLSAISTNALSTELGAPAPISWRLLYDSNTGQTSLRYGKDEQSPVIFSWPGKEGKFIYLDTKMQRHETWPPPTGLWPQLPAVIILETSRNGAPWSIIAAPAAPQIPRTSRTQHLFAQKKGD